MKPETRLWNRMRPGIAPFCFAQRIENLVGEGVPDVVLHSRVSGHCAFVELKCRLLMPVRESTTIFKGDYGLRPEQVAWIYGRAMAGANVWILGQGGDWLVLVHGKHARELESMTADDLIQAAGWYGAARKTDWKAMLEAMQL